jgi:Xaa-Pro dipeptidase
VKTPEEVRRLSHAAAVTQSALDSARGALEPGVTEAEAEREFLRALVSAGGRPGVTLVRFGRGGVEGQVRPSDRRLQSGEHVWWDVMVTVDGYWADLARVDRASELDRDAERAYRALMSGMNAAIASARAGARACDVWAATLSEVHAAGLEGYRRHHVGHGIGVEVYDDPMIAVDVVDELESGAVISLETPYYAFGLGALHVEAPVVVRPEGSERLLVDHRGGQQIDA